GDRNASRRLEVLQRKVQSYRTRDCDCEVDAQQCNRPERQAAALLGSRQAPRAGARSLRTLGRAPGQLSPLYVIALWSEISCDSVRCMRSSIVQQRSVVVVVVLEDRAG